MDLDDASENELAPEPAWLGVFCRDWAWLDTAAGKLSSDAGECMGNVATVVTEVPEASEVDDGPA